MYNFNLQIPTKIHFGKGMVVNLGKDILEYSDKVLLVYGGGSIKKNGIYKDVTDELIKNKIEWVELADVDPTQE